MKKEPITAYKCGTTRGLCHCIVAWHHSESHLSCGATLCNYNPSI